MPSTVHALVTGGDALAATRAAGALLGAPTVPRGVAAHVAVSAGWTLVLRAAARRWTGSGVVGGAVAGLAIAVLDLEVVRVPAIRALPRLPQYLDHVVFGAVVGGLSTRAVTGRSRRVAGRRGRRRTGPNAPLWTFHRG
ncbi:hypothetical protein [Actinosynnema sp. NPDC020468]|uniref:hypothetical protein n=1 Tax=Actinosynnema sp. NPDC020468 TaxID=3154488 RepID=UPI0033C8CC35